MIVLVKWSRAICSRQEPAAPLQLMNSAFTDGPGQARGKLQTGRFVQQGRRCDSASRQTWRSLPDVLRNVPTDPRAGHYLDALGLSSLPPLLFAPSSSGSKID